MIKIGRQKKLLKQMFQTYSFYHIEWTCLFYILSCLYAILSPLLGDVFRMSSKLLFFPIRLGFDPPKLHRDARFCKITFRAVFRCCKIYGFF